MWVKEETVDLSKEGLGPATKWLHTGNGLSLVYSQADSPIIKCTLCIRTPVDDNNGLPHILEHLIFFGSKTYPYKGYLDNLACRWLSSGTNALTEWDHTCYEVACASGTGSICNILPVFLDHILFPTLPQSAFYTEVHHLDGKGQDAGVLYNELREREYDKDLLLQENTLRCLFPHCESFCAEGKLKNIRDNVNLELVRQYHSTFYHPGNIRIIIVGSIDITQVLMSIEHVTGVNDSSSARAPRGLDPFNPTNGDDEFPSAEKRGRERYVASVAFALPFMRFQSFLTTVALTGFLVDHPDGMFTELARQGYSSSISHSVSEVQPNMCVVCFTFKGVKRQHDIKGNMRKLLSNFQFRSKETFFKEMQVYVRNLIVAHRVQLEKDPHAVLTELIKCDFLYGNGQFQQRLDFASQMEEVLVEGRWSETVSSWLRAEWITVKSTFKTTLYQQLMNEERVRVEQRIDSFGQPGLADLEKSLQRAIEANKMLAICPQIHLSANTVHHNVEDIKLPTLIYNSTTNILHIPLSNFAYIYIFIDTDGLSQDERCYIPLFCEALSLALEEHDILTSSKVSVGLRGDRFHCGIGSHLLAITAQVTVPLLEDGIRQLQAAVYGDTFNMSGRTVQDLCEQLQCMANDATEEPEQLVRSLHDGILYKDNANHRFTCASKQSHHLANSTQQESVAALERLHCRFKRNRCFVQVAASDLEGCKNALVAWTHPLAKEIAHNCAKSYGESRGEQCVESAHGRSGYMLRSVGVQSENVPALMLISEYMTGVEGPMWESIRGEGLAYSVSMWVDVWNQRLYLSINSSSDLERAFLLAKSVLFDFVSSSADIQPGLLERAKRSLIFRLIEKESHKEAAIVDSILGRFCDADKYLSARSLMSKVNDISVSEMDDRVKASLRLLLEDIYCCTAKIVAPTEGQ